MKSKLLSAVAVLVALAAAAGGYFYLFRKDLVDKWLGTQPPQEVVSVSKASPTPLNAAQQELDQLTGQLIADLRAESRLNLSMTAQLRAYQEMMQQVQKYGQRIENDIHLIEQISKDEFQEDVTLQASLFNGKKASIVAQHLEEFRASRVGAILAKMKDKEAANVMDIWASNPDPKVGAFYRDVMAAYLTNKRRDMHPELFNQVANQAAPSTAPAKASANPAPSINSNAAAPPPAAAATSILPTASSR